jgi:1-acyl-sn-glycerol-3-phosphate acyltransferase
MNLISGKILKILGWKITDNFPDLNKSVIIFAPHTSYWDGLYGKLYLMNAGINYKFLSKKEFFKFPIKYFFKAFGSIPVYKNKEYINQIAELYNNNKELHIVLSPEGQMAKTTHWKKGFYYMAEKANVPIVVGFIDYKKKELGIKGVITENNNITTTMTEINKMYMNINAKYPENFATDKRFN